MQKAHRQWIAVATVAASARLNFSLVVLFFANFGVQYDSSADLPVLDCSAGTSQSPLRPPPPILTGLHRLAVWDTQYFVRITKCGYEFEQFHAFFPLLPAVLRGISRGHGGW